MLLVADNVINTYNLLTALYKLAPVFAAKVSRPYFSTSPQGAREKFGLGTRLKADQCPVHKPPKTFKIVQYHLPVKF